MTWAAAIVWTFGLCAIIGVSMWADQRTRLSFWTILVTGIICSVLLGQLVSSLL